MLEYASTRVSRQHLADILNIATKGKWGPLGTIDLALKCKWQVVALLRQYGATEQGAPPDNWTRGYRRDTEYAYHQAEAKRVFVFVNNELT